MMSFHKNEFDPVYMNEAIRLAHRAGELGEVPIGAVVVCDGVIIGEGWNVRETEQNVCGHAELLALRSACRHLGSWRLDNCDLYVTLEPCIMCAGAIQNARLRNLFFGAYDPKAGACGSRWDILSLPGLNHDVFVQGGLMREECARLIHSFFRDLRAQNKRIEQREGGRGARRKFAKENKKLIHPDENQVSD
ncbi:MAG: tRNA adenosine(34) deaminase TadA [Fastidiosipilaceae bacterium]|jgi:tRNA(adenine34) deaminase